MALMTLCANAQEPNIGMFPGMQKIECDFNPYQAAPKPSTRRPLA